MNELQRQSYLASIGIDTYMPRWHLPYAPISLPAKFAGASLSAFPASISESSVELMPQVSDRPNVQVPFVPKLIEGLLDSKTTIKSASKITSAADILEQLDVKPTTVEPFSLSIWRPFKGLVIIDSRNSRLALPTELLIRNILQTLFATQSMSFQEEVLRWPMIENSFIKRTTDDARTELQTWLSVENEIRPLQYILLMGSNAATYLLQDKVMYEGSINKIVTLKGSTLNALILPSLSEILQNPIIKRQIYSALSGYISA